MPLLNVKNILKPVSAGVFYETGWETQARDDGRRGHSYAVILPMEVVKKWNWREKQKVVLTINSKPRSIVIKDWRK
jgi:hypothetical protein